MCSYPYLDDDSGFVKKKELESMGTIIADILTWDYTHYDKKLMWSGPLLRVATIVVY